MVKQGGYVALVLGAVYLLGAFLETSVNQYLLLVVLNIGIAIILSLSLNLVNGCAGQFSLGHAGFMAVGAYFSAALSTQLGVEFFATAWGSFVCVLCGGVVAGVMGYLVGLPSLRLRGDYLAIVTLGFGEIIRVAFLNMEFLGGARGLSGIPRMTSFFSVYVWLILCFVVIYRLLYSSTGRAILSVREDEVASQSCGINISHYKVFAFVVSAFFAGIAGGLFAHLQAFIDPNTFNFNRSVEVVIMVVIGGMGSISGAIVGAILVSLLPEVLRSFQEYRMIVFSGLLIISMLLRPMGLFGHREIWDLIKWKKQTA